jgi:hypothetical protein
MFKVMETAYTHTNRILSLFLLIPWVIRPNSLSDILSVSLQQAELN